MLRIRALQTYYGASQALFGVDLNVGEGEVVTLLGRNGMGKTTTVRSIMGLAEVRAGDIFFDNVRITQRANFEIARLGIGLVPEGRQIFPNLTVRENLLATAVHKDKDRDWSMRGIFELFPALAERVNNYGNQLSGGEQQMLAIGRALMTNPRLLVLDEATEGLAPLVRQEIWCCLRRLKDVRLSILVIDKNLDALMQLADRHFIMERGVIVWTGDSSALRNDPELMSSYLGV